MNEPMSEDENDKPGTKSEGMVFNLIPDEEVVRKLRSLIGRMSHARNSPKWNSDVERMHEALAQEGIGSPVMEMYSPARVNGMAQRLGIVPGLSLDLTTNDTDDR